MGGLATLLAGGSGGTGLAVIIVLSMTVPLGLLAVACWVFWKAARRERDQAGSHR